MLKMVLGLPCKRKERKVGLSLSAAALIVMGIIASLLRRYAAVEPIPRRDKGMEYEVMFFEEERIGPGALEARGDRFISSGRLRLRVFEEAAYSYVLAEKCTPYLFFPPLTKNLRLQLYQSLLI